MTMSRTLICSLAALTLTLAACDSVSDDAGPTTIDADVLADTTGATDGDGSKATGPVGDTDSSTATGGPGDADLSTATGFGDSDLATSTGPSAGDLASSTASGDGEAATGSAEPAAAAPTEAPDDTDLADPSLNPAEAKADSPDGLLATTVSVGVYPDYDRVVFTLEGDGAPGYSIRYADEAVEDGSGTNLEVDGDAVLQVNITGTRYANEGETYEGGPGTFSPDGTEEVEQVRLLSTFEGQTQAFIGIDNADTPFRVFTLSEPSRLVIDVVHQ